MIKAARSSAGLTQAELGERAGVAQPVVSAYERGRRQPTLPVLWELIAAAGADFDWCLEQARLTMEPVSSPRWKPLSAARAMAPDGADHERLRLIAQFVDDFARADDVTRRRLVARVPPPCGDTRFDALIAGLVEHLCAEAGIEPPAWTGDEDLEVLLEVLRPLPSRGARDALS
jgi:transcriptional regulator with XRE-family HTH domain